MAALLVFSARSEGEIEPRIWPHGFNIREIGEHGESLGVLQRFGCSWQGNPGQIGIEARFPSNSARGCVGQEKQGAATWARVVSRRKEGEGGSARAGWPVGPCCSRKQEGEGEGGGEGSWAGGIGPGWGTGCAARPTGWLPSFSPFFPISFLFSFPKPFPNSILKAQTNKIKTGTTHKKYYAPA